MLCKTANVTPPSHNITDALHIYIISLIQFLYEFTIALCARFHLPSMVSFFSLLLYVQLFVDRAVWKSKWEIVSKFLSFHFNSFRFGCWTKRRCLICFFIAIWNVAIGIGYSFFYASHYTKRMDLVSLYRCCTRYTITIDSDFWTSSTQEKRKKRNGRLSFISFS